MTENGRPDLEKRLELVSYLRQSSEDNKRRLHQANSILYGGEYAENELYSGEEVSAGEHETKTALGSFAKRLVLSGLLLFFALMLKSAKDEPIAASCSRYIENSIQTDYSQNLFDFIRDLPYTLTYEKTNASGRDPVKN